jgi:hypothetical protein
MGGGLGATSLANLVEVNVRKVFCFLLIALSFNLYAQSKNLQEIKDATKDIYKIKVMEFENRKSPVRFVDTLDTSHYLYDFVQQNRLLLDYLLQNQLKVKPDSMMKLVDDAKELDKYLYDSIEKDSSFTNSLTDLICNYLTTQNILVPDYNYSSKYDVSIDKIASIAARFFYPNKLVGDGKAISMKLCVGALSFKDYDSERNFLEEAFAFSVVMGSAQSDIPELVEEYKKEAKFAINMDLSTQEDVRLNRMQGAIWALLSKNSKMIEAIKKKFDEQKNSLPFTIIY